MPGICRPRRPQRTVLYRVLALDPLSGLSWEHLLTFSCKTRGFCPPCHAKRLEEWGEWVSETLPRARRLSQSKPDSHS